MTNKHGKNVNLPTDEKVKNRDFPGGTVVRNPPANAGDMGSIREDPTCRGATKQVHHNC